MAIVDGRIRCSSCKEYKELERFQPSARKVGCGVCTKCRTENKAKKYRADPAAGAAEARRYRENRRAQYNDSQREWLKAQDAEKKQSYALKKYGMTAECYRTLLDKQDGGCAICGATTNKNGKALFVDHCHDSGRVRGILCYKCNTGLGSFGDNPALISKALNYLQMGD